MKLQTMKTVGWSAIGGALVWWIILGAVFGWMPTGTAEQKAGAQAEAAVREALTPICVEMFHQDVEREVKLQALEEAYAWKQADYVVKQGWATMPGAEAPEKRIAKACATNILAANRSTSDMGRQ
jgi:hypothetical protein